MSREASFAWLFAVFLAAWVSSAAALDREGAIEAAKRQMRGKCSTATPCTFDARLDNRRWTVRVEFTAPNPGGHALLMFDQSGKLVGRVEGK